MKEIEEIEVVNHTRHLVAAVVSIVLSLIFHTVVLYYLSEAKLRMWLIPDNVEESAKFEPIKLKDVFREAGKIVSASKGEGRLVSSLSAKRETETLAAPLDESVIEPPALTEKEFFAESKPMADHSAAPEREKWEPRQDVIQIEKKTVDVEMPELERKDVSLVERVGMAPDITYPAEREAVSESIQGMEEVKSEPASQVDISQTVMGGVGRETAGLGFAGGLEADFVGGLFEEKRDAVTEMKPIENLLTAEIQTFKKMFDSRYGYFKIEIDRAGAEVLPVVPKDIIFVQDCSASMAEQRLYFCRTGMVACLDFVGSEDNFNIVGFRDRSEFCFKGWAKKNPETIKKATDFIANMESHGSTDLFKSIKDLLSIKRTPGRPVVVFLVTDGRPTTGLMNSSSIIGEFSKLNNGSLSIFTMGTIKIANTYLLDLLGSCNKGGTYQVTGGRWGIPETMVAAVKGVNSPLLTDVAIRFPQGSGIEVYPEMTSNLYLDKTFVIYGRYPKDMKNAVFQVLGKTVDLKCDMIFDFSLKEEAKRGDKDILQSWASQKIYYLIGEYTRTRDPDVLRQIRIVAKEYNISIPYSDDF